MKRSAIIISCVILLAGCMPLSPRSPEQGALEAAPAASAILQKASQPLPLPPPAFVEEVVPAPDDHPEVARLFTFSFNAVPLSQVLQALLGELSLNLSVEEGVALDRPVTVHLKNGTLEEALELAVVKGAGYSWHLTGDRLEIVRFVERLYRFDYLDVVSSSDITVGGDMLGAGVSQSGVSGKFEVKSTKADGKSDIWEQLGEILKGMKSKEGLLQINRTSGLIYLSDTPRHVAAMVAFLDSIQESLNRQVFIEAKILDVVLKDDFRYGIDWSSIQAAISPGELAKILPDRLDITWNRGGSLILSNTTSLAAVVDFLSTQGDISVLSNPHISAMNGRPAIMTVGSQFPFADITGVSRDEETNDVTIDGSIKRAVFGLQLGITPQIGADGLITLHVVPTITRQEGTEAVEIPFGGVGVQSIDNPVIGLQELATTVRVRDGEAIVLAGLITQENAEQASGIPGLRELPVLGYLFGNGEKVSRSRELVILIKPHIKGVL